MFRGICILEFYLFISSEANVIALSAPKSNETEIQVASLLDSTLSLVSLNSRRDYLEISRNPGYEWNITCETEDITDDSHFHCNVNVGSINVTFVKELSVRLICMFYVIFYHILIIYLFQIVLPGTAAKMRDSIEISDLSFEVTGKRHKAGKVKLLSIKSYAAEVIATPLFPLACVGDCALSAVFQSVNAKLKRASI